MNKVRFRYSKTGKAKFISHLDLMTTLQRSFLRAGIKLKYSEGFNPHPYMSVALPLSVGCESLCEMIDVAIQDSIIPDIGKIKLPEGITINDAYIPNRKFNDIEWIEINACLRYDDKADENVSKKLFNCFTKDCIIISKRTKRGFKELDIAPYIKDVDISSDGGICLKAKISAQNPTINTDDLLSAVQNDIKPVFVDLKRIDIYDSNMLIFK